MDWSELEGLSFLDRLEILREILVRRMRQSPDLDRARTIEAIDCILARFSAITVFSRVA